MTLNEIIKRYDMLSSQEKRRSTEDYDERVFYNKDIDEWNKVFTDIFGPPTKPTGTIPTEDDLDLARDYGGIWINQTLFKKESDNVVVVAMLWPWQDKVHTTLKTILLKE